MDEPTCALVFTFRAPDSAWSNFVAKITSWHKGERFCHTDVGVYNPSDGDNVMHAYSSYAKQLLTRTRLDQNGYTGADVALAYSVTADEARTARAYLDAMVERETAYNYEDLPLCILPRRATSMLADTDANDVDKVFCSQLAILTLRKSLLSTEQNADLHKALDCVNSRCTSPNALFVLLQPHCHRLKLPQYCMGKLQTTNY